MLYVDIRCTVIEEKAYEVRIINFRENTNEWGILWEVVVFKSSKRPRGHALLNEGFKRESKNAM